MAIFPVLYNIALKLINFTLSSLYLLVPHPLSPLVTSSCFLYKWVYFCFVIFLALFCFLDSIWKWQHTVLIAVILTYANEWHKHFMFWKHFSDFCVDNELEGPHNNSSREIVWKPLQPLRWEIMVGWLRRDMLWKLKWDGQI